MEKFTQLEGKVLPLDRANVDTDAIIPKQFLKSIKKSGFGAYLFDEWRFSDLGEIGKLPEDRPKRAEFVLNDTRYTGASILLARENFGCGSSREHAVWALSDYGFRAVIAPSFADIFYNNCFKNGVLPIVLPESVVNALFELATETQPLTLTIDLAAQTAIAGEQFHSFDIDAFRKTCLLNGFDAIGLTLQHAEDIKHFEADYQRRFPWLFSP